MDSNNTQNNYQNSYQSGYQSAYPGANNYQNTYNNPNAANNGRPGYQPVYVQTPPTANAQLEQTGKLISPWGYIGYNILFAIPIVGFILILVFSFNSGSLNRKNYARSYLCAMLIVLILAVIIVILALVFGASLSSILSESASSMYY